MGEAFDSACKELHDQGQPTIVYEVIAKRIIEADLKGTEFADYSRIYREDEVR